MKNEELLGIWLKISSQVSNRRFVNRLSLGEALVCNLLLRKDSAGERNKLTQTDLCRETGMLKSQMNKVLNSLEGRGMIERVRDTKDKRYIYISIREENLGDYKKDHDEIMGFIDRLIMNLGIEETEKAIKILNDLSDALAKTLGKEK